MKFATERTDDSITLNDVKDKIEELSNSQDEHKYKHLVSYPGLTVKFKSKKWTWAAARKVLHEYFQIEGFGKGSKKCFGKDKDEPENWPDTIAWTTFKGPSYTNLETCNEIIESFLSSHHLDPYEYHVVEEPEADDAAVDHRENDNNDNFAPTLDPTGQWRWDYNLQQWIAHPPLPPTLEPTGRWRWDYNLQQWLPHPPPELEDQQEQQNDDETDNS